MSTSPFPFLPLPTTIVNATAADASVFEGAYAVTHYTLTKPTNAFVDINLKVSLQGVNATVAEDYSTWAYQTNLGGTGDTATGTWITLNGYTLQDITLATTAPGVTNLWFKVQTLVDGNTDSNESVKVVVSQVDGTANAGIKDSWYVESQVAIKDAAAGPAPTLRVITAVTTTAGTDGYSGSSNGIEGANAIATFQIDTVVYDDLGTPTYTPALLETATKINAQAVMNGGTFIDDTTNLFYFRTHTSSGWSDWGLTGWTPVAGNFNKTPTLPVGTDQFQLGMDVKADLLTETNESINFIVGQNSSVGGLKDSYYVNSQIALVDRAVTQHTGVTGAGDASKVDNFTFTAGGVVANVAALKTVVDFGAGDTLTLPSGVARILTTIDITGHTWSIDTLVELYNAIDGTDFIGSGGVLQLVDNGSAIDAMVPASYLVVDMPGVPAATATAHGNHLFDTTGSSPDLFIKLTGTAATTIDLAHIL